MNANFGAEAWKEVSKKCIGCGACTFVCPTCYCFDIRDEKDNQQGKRYRCWDFCTSYLYTLEASGHNPRAELSQKIQE
ncbi:MAG: 4Fe-4S dicluster domain-containing protein [Actinomycetota bacterium]|nr:4Fe-4S dicluster domain-containing protein [Actinomycetota bacterium]